MKIIFLLLGLLIISNSYTQTYKIKGAVWGLPLFQSGFGIGTLGLEVINKKEIGSFQFSFNMAGGSIATDVEITKRQWVVVEKIFYVKTKREKTQFFYSAFTEIGMRKKLPGYSHFPPDSILQDTKQFEINPGVAIGVNFRIKKRWGFDILTGPKLIIANARKTYYNSVTKTYFVEKYRDIEPGFRAIASFSYKF